MIVTDQRRLPRFGVSVLKQRRHNAPSTPCVNGSQSPRQSQRGVFPLQHRRRLPILATVLPLLQTPPYRHHRRVGSTPPTHRTRRDLHLGAVCARIGSRALRGTRQPPHPQSLLRAHFRARGTTGCSMPRTPPVFSRCTMETGKARRHEAKRAPRLRARRRRTWGGAQREPARERVRE